MKLEVFEKADMSNYAQKRFMSSYVLFATVCMGGSTGMRAGYSEAACRICGEVLKSSTGISLLLVVHHGMLE
jgi:hypothetical protein